MVVDLRVLRLFLILLTWRGSVGRRHGTRTACWPCLWLSKQTKQPCPARSRKSGTPLVAIRNVYSTGLAWRSISIPCLMEDISKCIRRVGAPRLISSFLDSGLNRKTPRVEFYCDSWRDANRNAWSWVVVFCDSVAYWGPLEAEYQAFYV